MSRSIKLISDRCAAICTFLPILLVLLQLAHIYAPCCGFSRRCCVVPTDFSFPSPVLSDIPVSPDTLLGLGM